MENRQIGLTKQAIDDSRNNNIVEVKASPTLFEACKEGNITIVRSYLEAGEDVDQQEKVAETNVWLSPLMIASRNGNVRLVTLLLHFNAQVNLRDKGRGQTALIWTSKNGHTEVAQLLHEYGAQVDRKNYYGRTALMAASQNGHTEVIQLLHEYGAQVDIKNNNGRTALMAASWNGHTEVVQLLHEYGAQVDIKNNNGWTALMAASQNGHTEVIQLLHEYGAQIDIKNNDGWTALMVASQNGHTKVVQLLHEYGAQVDMIEEEGWTALMVVSQNGDVEIVKLLHEYGAQMDLQTNEGDTALILAEENGHSDIVQLLHAYGALRPSTSRAEIEDKEGDDEADIVDNDSCRWTGSKRTSKEEGNHKGCEQKLSNTQEGFKKQSVIYGVEINGINSTQESLNAFDIAEHGTSMLICNKPKPKDKRDEIFLSETHKSCQGDKEESLLHSINGSAVTDHQAVETNTDQESAATKERKEQLSPSRITNQEHSNVETFSNTFQGKNYQQNASKSELESHEFKTEDHEAESFQDIKSIFPSFDDNNPVDTNSNSEMHHGTDDHEVNILFGVTKKKSMSLTSYTKGHDSGESYRQNGSHSESDVNTATRSKSMNQKVILILIICASVVLSVAMCLSISLRETKNQCQLGKKVFNYMVYLQFANFCILIKKHYVSLQMQVFPVQDPQWSCCFP